MKELILQWFILGILAVFAILSAFVGSKYSKLLSKYCDIIKYLKSLCNCVSSARWGNLQIRAQKGPSVLTTELSKSLNSLLESILDRDKMI